MDEKLTIHVIDDDDAVRDSLCIMLAVQGFAVYGYPSGAAFLHEADVDADCCLLVDMHMPGMGGIELLQRIRHEGIETAAVLMTGRADASLGRALVPGIRGPRNAV